MKKLLLWFVLVLALAATAAAGVLLYSETALQWTVRQAQPYVPGLAVGELRGRLAGPLEVRGLRYENDTVRFSADRIALDWRPGRLILFNVVHVTTLVTEGISLTIAGGTEEPRAEREGPLLPVRVRINHLDTRDTRIALGEQEPFLIDALSLRLRTRDDTLIFDNLHLDAARPRVLLNADGEVPLNGRGPVRLAAELQADIEQHRIAGTLNADGSTANLRAEAAFTSPLQLNVSARGELERDEPRWNATVIAEPFTLSSLLPTAPPLAIERIELTAQGQGGAVSGQLRGAVRENTFGAWRLAVDGGWDGERWSIPRLLIAAARGEARIEGQAHQNGDELTAASADINWTNLSWPPAGNATAHSPVGSLQLSGTPEDYRYRVDGELQAAGLPPLTLQLAGHGDRLGTELETLAARWLDGDWRGRAMLAWSPMPSWDLTLDAQGINPATLHPDVSGALSGRIEVSGRYDQTLSLDARLRDFGGEISGQPLHGALHATLRAGALTIEDALLAAGSTELMARGGLDENWQIDWSLRAPELAELAKGLSGTLHAEGTVSGPPDALRTQTTLQAQNLAYREHGLDTLSLNAGVDLGIPSAAGNGSGGDHGSWIDAIRWQAELRIDGVRSGERALGDIALDTAGDSARHTALLQTEHQTLTFTQRLQGSLTDDRWRATLSDGRLVQADIGIWAQSAPAAIEAARERLALEPYCWESAGARICAEATREGENAVRGALLWEALDIMRLSTVLPLDSIELAGVSRGHARLRYEHDRLQADIDAEAHDGTVRHAMAQQAPLRYEQATLQLNADEEGLHADIDFDISTDERITAVLTLPGFRFPDPPAATVQAIEGRVEIDIGELSALSLFIPDVHLDKGEAHLQLTVGGTLAEPRVDGALDLAVTSASILRLGARIDDLRLRADIRGNELELGGGARMGDGELTLRGSGRLENLQQWEGELRIEGENLEAVRLPPARIRATPRITLQLRPHELLFDGSLTIPWARLEPIAPEGTVPVSDDVVVVGRKVTSNPQPFRAHGRLELIFGNDVTVEGRGFDGKLAGRLLLLVAREGGVTAQGEVRFVDGRYRAYGQNLLIKQGRVLYAGGPVSNPAIDVVASRTRGERDEVEVGVRVIGTARSPSVELYSTPAMDDADILSYLIIGRPLNEAGAGEGPDLYQAATSVAIAGGKALADKIGERFDLVEISIETDEQTDDTALILGRSLSPNLYIRYIQGLMQDTSAVQLRYELNKNWAIETESGTRTGAGADILYTLER